MKNIFAYTPPIPNPPYISVNEASDPGYGVSFTVRSPPIESLRVSMYGATAEINLTVEQARDLAYSILAHFQ